MRTHPGETIGSAVARLRGQIARLRGEADQLDGIAEVYARRAGAKRELASTYEREADDAAAHADQSAVPITAVDDPRPVHLEVSPVEARILDAIGDAGATVEEVQLHLATEYGYRISLIAVHAALCDMSGRRNLCRLAKGGGIWTQ